MASELNAHGFFVSGTVAQLGSVHDGVLEFPDVGALPVRIRVRATDAQRTHCHFYDLSLKQQATLKGFLARYAGGADDEINELSYDEIARGEGSKSGPATVHKIVSNGNGAKALPKPNGNGNSHAAVTNGKGHGHEVLLRSGPAPVRLPQEALSEPPPVKALASVEPKEPSVKKSTGLIAMAVLLVGIVTIATLVYMFFRSQSSIPVQSAVLLGNYIPVKSIAEGVLDDVFVVEGDRVRAGDPLFRVVDQKIEAAYAEAMASMASADIERESAAKSVESAKMQARVAAGTLKGSLDVAKAALNHAQIELKRHNSLVNRLKPLTNPNRRVIPQAKYDEAVMARDAAQANYAMQEAELNRLEERGKMLKDSNVLMVGDRVDQSLPLAESKLASCEAALAELRSRMKYLEKQREGFTLKAPQDGTVYASYLKKGSFVKVGGEVLAIGTREENWAIGHVTQKMAMKVLPGQKVRIKMPALGVTALGEVASVGHRGIYSQTGWNPDFRADPTLVPIKVTLPDMPYKIPAGLRIGMVIELDYQWPWEKKEAQRDDLPENATVVEEDPAS